jgi:hypothetical protein
VDIEGFCEAVAQEVAPFGIGVPIVEPAGAWTEFRHTTGTTVQEKLGDPRLTAEFLGHLGLGSVAGFIEVSRRRHEEAAD